MEVARGKRREDAQHLKFTWVGADRDHHGSQPSKDERKARRGEARQGEVR